MSCLPCPRTCHTPAPPLAYAASWDTQLVQHVFDAVSDELRAKNNEQFGLDGAYRCGSACPPPSPACLPAISARLRAPPPPLRRGLVCWTPHVNLFRDPRWGRGSETYGEDVSTAGFAKACSIQRCRGHPLPRLMA